jgi:flagellar biosynthesis protein FlhB
VLAAQGGALADAFSQLMRGALSGQLPMESLRALGRALAWLLCAPAAAALALLVLQRAPALRFLRSDADPRAPSQRPRPYGHALSACVTALKLGVLLLALGALLAGSAPGLLAAGQRSAAELLALLPRVLGALALRAAWVLLALGALDLLAQQAVRLSRLRMTRRELLDEQRELVGDPFILGERRARARELPDEQLTPQLYAAKLSQLSAATLVLTGEGRALALQYAPERASPPVLWLKAEGREAVELVARAYAMGVPLASDSVLADDLYRLAPLAPIPAAAHVRVAQLMAASVRDPRPRGAVS